jgi:hypothetical protein
VMKPGNVVLFLVTGTVNPGSTQEGSPVLALARLQPAPVGGKSRHPGGPVPKGYDNFLFPKVLNHGVASSNNFHCGRGHLLGPSPSRSCHLKKERPNNLWCSILLCCHVPEDKHELVNEVKGEKDQGD